MLISHGMNLKLIRLVLAILLLFPITCTADIIARMQTSAGVIDVKLFDVDAPLTVANFLNYAESGAYNYTFFHRSVTGTAIYAGKYVWDGLINPVKPIVVSAPVQNEFNSLHSNLPYTLAMYKDVPNNPDSATSQWFFNLKNNSKGKTKYDSINGGYTVFGEVLKTSQPIFNSITALPLKDAGGDFSALPLATPLIDRSLRESNVVIINSISSNRVSVHGNESDRIFSLLERQFPEYLTPANPLDSSSLSLNGYYYRYYPKTESYIATFNGEVYFLGPVTGNQAVSIGSVASFRLVLIAEGY
jgi:cyclophilin family peptidyl-prolyl cis-trans isomerase